jgi:hypothetical protein
MDSPVEILGWEADGKNGGTAGPEETGIFDSQMRKRALIFESAAPLHMFTEPV